MPDAPTLDLVLRRNSIERLKREKFPFALMDELPELIERGYEDISEEDMVRFTWYGLYHDKPKVGTFMLRVKVPSGILSPIQFRTIGELSRRFGRKRIDRRPKGRNGTARARRSDRHPSRGPAPAGSSPGS